MNTPLPDPIPVQARLGIIGAGGRLQSLLTILQRVAPGLEVTAIHDPDERSIARFQSRFSSAPAICHSPEELCAREDVDWVLIGSWNCHHAEQAVMALRAGKHVFCEKPLALSLDQAGRMFSAWQESGRTFSLGMVLRYSPLYRAAKKVIDEGRLGKIVSFEFNETLGFNHGGFIHGDWRRLTRNAGSHLLEKCCHDLDLAMWLMNDRPVRTASFGGLSLFTPENVDLQAKIGPNADGRPAFQGWDISTQNPFTSEKDIVDHQVAILEFSGGVRATFHTNCSAALTERRFYILGTEGSLRLDAYSGRLEVRRIGWEETTEDLNPISGDGHAGADEPMCRELAACMAGELPPAAGILDGIRSLVVAQAMDRAMHEGRVVDIAPTWLQVQSLTK